MSGIIHSFINLLHPNKASDSDQKLLSRTISLAEGRNQGNEFPNQLTSQSFSLIKPFSLTWLMEKYLVKLMV